MYGEKSISTYFHLHLSIILVYHFSSFLCHVFKHAQSHTAVVSDTSMVGAVLQTCLILNAVKCFQLQYAVFKRYPKWPPIHDYH